jgi:hypothetical protein
MAWAVQFSNKRVEKQYLQLPTNVRAAVVALMQDIQLNGPIRGNWKNYDKLGADKHHCHVKKGRPTYVVCWEVIDNKVKLVEVYYAGTHEKAPY